MTVLRRLALALILALALGSTPSISHANAAPLERAAAKYCGRSTDDGNEAFTSAKGISCKRAKRIANRATPRIYQSENGRVRVGRYTCALRALDQEEDEPGYNCRYRPAPGKRVIYRTEL